MYLTVLLMLPKYLLGNKNNHYCSSLNYENVTAAHLAIVKNSYGSNIQIKKYLYKQFVPSPRTAKSLILGFTLYNGNFMQIKLNISEPCGTFVSIVRCVSSRIQLTFIMYQNPRIKLHNLQLAIVFKIRNQEIDTKKVII